MTSDQWRAHDALAMLVHLEKRHPVTMEPDEMCSECLRIVWHAER